MDAEPPHHVALTASLARWAEGMVASGGYASVSDLVRTALRRLEEDHRDGADGRASERVCGGAPAAPRGDDLVRLWQNAHDLQVVIDHDGTFLSVSPSATRLLGWGPDEMVGRSLFAFISTDEEEAASREALRQAATEPMSKHRNRYRHKDGGDRWIEWRTTPEAGAIYCYGRDVTGEVESRAFNDTLERRVAAAQSDAERVQLALAAGAIVGTWFWDMPTDRFTVDEAFAIAFGLDPALGREGIPLAQIVATVHPDDRAGLAEAIDEAVRRGGRYAHQYRVRRRDGRYHWLEANGHVEHAPDGTPLRFPGVLLDIGERRAVEAERERAVEALRHLNADLERRILERSFARGRTWQVSPDLLAVVDGEGRFEATNPAWTAALGWSEEDLVHKPFMDFVHPGDLGITRAVWADANERGLPVLHFQNRYRHKNGGWRWLSWVGVPDDGRVYGSARDITAEVDQGTYLRESQAREETVQQNNRRMQTSLAAGSIVGTWNWNFNEDFFTFDEGFAHAFGHELNTAQTGLRIDQVLVNVHPEDRPGLDAAIADTIAHGGSYARQYRVRRADGIYRWIEASGRIDHDADGKAFGFPGFVVDVDERVSLEAERDRATAELRALSDTLEARVAQRTSELLQAEEAMRQSQKMEAVGQLTGGVAHDFNNLLTVIKSSTDLLKRPNLSEERRARYVAAISDTADRAAKLTGQLLAFARRQTLKPEVFAACDSVRALSGMVGTLTGSRVTVTTDLPEHPSYVEVDPSQFDTALVNLAVNARDAMAGEGRITIAVRTVDTIPAVRTHPDRDGAYVAVSLSDTGSGMSADIVQRIFEPFFTTKEVGKGTGLGLSQVFGFAKQSGGDVTVDSTVGEGTTFTIYLPRVDAPVPAAAAAAPEALADGHGTRVLVVEDNADVGTFAVQSLTDLGYAPVLAIDGPAALAELAKDADRFDVVFSDVVMPGMSGVELGQEIRRLYSDLPVVLTSGYSHVLAQNGTHGFELLHKPYSIEQLSQILKAATWQRRRRLLNL